MLRHFLYTVFIICAGILAGCEHNKTTPVTSSPPQKMASRSIGVMSLDNTTINAARTLSNAFEKAAPRYGITLYKSTTSKADLYLRGYFSVLADEEPSKNAIVYVFDIINKAGDRLHRVQGKYMLGREVTQTQEGFWSFIGPDGYQEIANDIFSQIAAWLKTGGT